MKSIILSSKFFTWIFSPRGYLLYVFRGYHEPQDMSYLSFFLFLLPFILFSSSSLIFILCFTLIVVSSLEVRAFFYKPISSYLYRLIKKAVNHLRVCRAR